MMLIKPFTEKYLDDVYEIEKVCFSNPWSKEDLKRQIDRGTSYFLVADIDGRAVTHRQNRFYPKTEPAAP